jgi:hypothetical protein
MTDIHGLPFRELRYDADGNPDQRQESELAAALQAGQITDLVIFAHGWNNDPAIARRLYERFFLLLGDQLLQAPTARPTRVALAGVLWPSQLWPDEPIPDFVAPVAAPGGGGAASIGIGQRGQATHSAQLDDRTLADLLALFPTAAAPLKKMAALLAAPPTIASQAAFHTQMRRFVTLTKAAGDDGEDGRPRPRGVRGGPGMLLDEPSAVFERYTDALRQTGTRLVDGTDDTPGGAGIGDAFGKIWHGAKEALRQLTYWQMKHRAGTVGRDGLGPTIGRLNQLAPELRVHLVGHSFGARLVSYALAGLPAGLDPSPVKGVTLLEGAFSQWAFAPKLPFDVNRSGALAGMPARIDGPLAVVHSRHDGAVGTFYPLASIATGEDAAGLADATARWGGIGANGAQGVQARDDAVRGAGPGLGYPFAPGAVLNIDASEVVSAGAPPAGAHSDIVHAELTWIVASAGQLVA